MSNSMTFSIMTKPPGFFFRGGHESSDEELIVEMDDDFQYGEPTDDLIDSMAFSGGKREKRESSSDSELDPIERSLMAIEDEYEGGFPDFDSLISANNSFDGGSPLNESSDEEFLANKSFDELFEGGALNEPDFNDMFSE
jgi:hypothetical protein